MSPARNIRTAFTLVETVLALSIMAVISLAVTIMLSGAGHTYQYVNHETDALAQVEDAYRRIMHNLRTASAMSSPANTTATNSLTISTQPDPNYGNVAATVTYSISGGNLIENDSRYGTNVVVYNVGSFSVQRVTTTAPTQVTITITSGTIPAVTRSATITCRNI
jgi:type II secretory pathway component PulJ